MNWIDYFTIGLVAVFALCGLAKGFVMSVFRVASFFVSIFASIKFYPILAGILEKTPVYDAIKQSIVKTLLLRGHETAASSTTAVSGMAGANALIKPLKLPDILKKAMTEKLPNSSGLVDLQSIAGAIGDELTRMIISVISLIAVYIIVRLVLMLAGAILKGVSRLPVFKQIDKTGGFILGALQGFLAIFVICAALMLFNTNPGFAPIFKALDESVLAGWFYNNNFIINWMLPLLWP